MPVRGGDDGVRSLEWRTGTGMNSTTHRLWGRPRASAALWLLPLAASATIVVGCRPQPAAAPATPGSSTPAAAAGAAAPPSRGVTASQAEALATLTAVVAAAPGGPQVTGPDAASGGPPSGAAEPAAQIQVVNAQATANAEHGIADVNDLVQSMPPLATFTPAPAQRRPGGKLLYARSGGLYVAEPGTGDSKPIGSDKLPRVWSPPEDPGRAWAAPDDKHVAFFGGPDAELWVTSPDGKDARAVSRPNLPTDERTATLGGKSQTFRIRPGTDYTIVQAPGGEGSTFVLTDDNSRHIRGEARLRIIHGSPRYRDTPVRVFAAGSQLAGPIAYGASSGEQRVVAGNVALTITDDEGHVLASLPPFTAGDKELKSVFLYGDKELKAAQFSYEPGEPPSGNARVRLFNGDSRPLDADLGSGITLARGLQAGTLGDYVAVPTVLGLDDRKDAELALYGLRAGEEPVEWSPDGRTVAFIGFGDGQPDVYVAGLDNVAERVTNDAAREVNPRWSPDGRGLVWQALDEATNQTGVAVRAPGEGTPVTIDLTPILTKLQWSRSIPVQLPQPPEWVDNTRVALYPQSEGTSGGIWLYDTAQKALTQMYAEPITEVRYSAAAGRWAVAPKNRPGELDTVDLSGAVRPLARGDASAPDWSPGGKLISWVEGKSTSSDGWRIHVTDPDGKGDRALTDWWPILQAEPPVPGPRAKRAWLDGNRLLAFTRAGRDYGAAERTGTMSGSVKAGDDIENVWVVPVDGSAPPRQATDLTRVFYLKPPEASPDGRSWGLVGFSYLDRSQQLWVVPTDGGKPVKIDGGVRWYSWIR
jgi:hypothetical protein